MPPWVIYSAPGDLLRGPQHEVLRDPGRQDVREVQVQARHALRGPEVKDEPPIMALTFFITSQSTAPTLSNFETYATRSRLQMKFREKTQTSPCSGLLKLYAN